MTRLRPGTPAEAGFRPEALDRIRARTAEWAENPNTPVSVMLAARRGVIALHHANGIPGVTDGEPAEDPVFWCASMAKPVTATAIMMLVEEGHLSLNRPLNEYCPGFMGEHADRIQVHHLLTHTSGLVETVENGMPTWVTAPPPTTSPEPGQSEDMHRQIAYFQTQDCLKKPGTQLIYANANYAILGDVVRRVSGKRLGEFARERIFEPLGMTASAIGCDDALLERWIEVPGHFLTRELVREIDDDGSMMLFSTARDVAAFCQMFLNGGIYDGHRLLSAWTVHEMTRNQIPGVGCVDFYGHWTAEASWGLGWMVQGDARWPYSQGYLTPRGTYLHQGGGGTAMWVDPQHDVVGVYLTTAPLDPVTHNPHFEFDKFQNMVTVAIDHAT